MIINLGDAPFKAFIKVTYPKGTCTVSGEGQSYSHTGGGTVTFAVKKKGTYTIKAAANSYVSASATASITARGQTVSKSLSYTKYLFKSGSGVPSQWLLAKTGGYTTGSITASSIYLNSPAEWYQSARVGAQSVSTIDLRGYSTLKFDVATSNKANAYVGLTSAKFSGYSTESAGNVVTSTFITKAQPSSTSRQTISIPLSSYQGSYYIAALVSSVSTNLYVYNIWLEA